MRYRLHTNAVHNAVNPEKRVTRCKGMQACATYRGSLHRSDREGHVNVTFFTSFNEIKYVNLKNKNVVLMNKFLLLFTSVLVLMVSSCGKSTWTEDYYQTLFVASEKTENGEYLAKLIGQKRMSVEAHDVDKYGKYWFVYASPIAGFDEIYEEGYEYIICVKITYQETGIRNVKEETVGKTFVLDEVIMKNKADTFIDPNTIMRDYFD